MFPLLVTLIGCIYQHPNQCRITSWIIVIMSCKVRCWGWIWFVAEYRCTEFSPACNIGVMFTAFFGCCYLKTAEMIVMSGAIGCGYGMIDGGTCGHGDWWCFRCCMWIHKLQERKRLRCTDRAMDSFKRWWEGWLYSVATSILNALSWCDGRIMRR